MYSKFESLSTTDTDEGKNNHWHQPTCDQSNDKHPKLFTQAQLNSFTMDLYLLKE